MILGLKTLSESLQRDKNKDNKANTSITMRQIDENLISTYNKMKSIKEQVEDIKSQWKSLQEDVVGFNFAKAIYEGNSIKESFQKAIDDLKLEFEDTKNAYNYYKNLKNKILTEAETIAPNDLIDIDTPYEVDQPYSENEYDNFNSNDNNDSEKDYTYIARKLPEIIDREETEDTLQYLFNELVPESGKADTLAGELVRAIMDLLYNYKSPKKYVFYEGDGLNRCGSSAQYLIDHGYEEDFAEIINNIYRIDGLRYEEILTSIADKIIIDINENNLFTKNVIDSRSYNYDSLKEIAPIYEYIIKIPSNIQELYDDSFNIYNILRDIKEIFDEDGVSVSTGDIYDPKAGSISILDITKDTLDYLKGLFEDSKFWEDYYKDLASDLEEDLQILHDTLNENSDEDNHLVDIFMQYHEDSKNYENNPYGYEQVYEILDQYGDETEDVDILFKKATEEEQREMIDLIRPKDEFLN